MRRHLTYAATLALILALVVPASALAARLVTNTIGEDRAAINHYHALLAQTYEELWHEPLPTTIEDCEPPGPNSKRVTHLLCADVSPTIYAFLVATNRRNQPNRWLPAEYHRTAVFGSIVIYTTEAKARSGA